MRRALLLASCVAAASCLDPTQATVVITTNVDCGPEEAALGTLFETGVSATGSRTTSADGLATTTPACTPRESGIHDIGDIVIFPADGATEGSVVVVGALDVDVDAEDCLDIARGEGDPNEAASCIIARRTVPFADHTMLRVPILLDRFCAGVVCAAGTTCVAEGGGPRCVEDRVICGGESCNVDGAGGGASGGGGAGTGGEGGGGAPPALDCSAVEAVYQPVNGAELLQTIAGVEGVYPDGPLLLATGVSPQSPFLWEIAGGSLELQFGIPSTAVGLDAALVGDKPVVGIAESIVAEYREIGTALGASQMFGAIDAVIPTSGSLPYFVDGRQLSRFEGINLVTVQDFSGTIGLQAGLTSLTSAGNRVFAVGSHVCFWGPSNQNDCGSELTNAWIDAWAQSEARLFGLGDSFVSVTDALGTSAASEESLPRSLPGPVSLRKIKGRTAVGQAVVFVGGAAAQGAGYLARGVFDGAAFAWSECTYPGLGGVIDLWVNADGTEAYFVTALGAAYRQSAEPL